MKRVTIYNVAKEAGVSLATVSRVINGADVVKQPTREKVEAAIEKLGYKPNAIAQGLALQKTTNIALVVPEASFNYTAQVIYGLNDVAKIYNYTIMLHMISPGITSLNDVIEDIIKSRVDGVIIYNNNIQISDVEELNRYNIPMVFIASRVNADNVCNVYVDIEKAIYELTMKCLEEGKDAIGILEDRKNKLVTNQMVNGAKKAYKQMGKVFDGFIPIPSEARSSYAYLKNTIGKEHYDLIIANRDSQAMALLNSARENGIEVPNDMEIVCFIDTKYNSMTRPQISSFSVPSYDLGAVSMRVMTKMLQGMDDFDRNIELNYLFTPRQTTKS